MFCDRISSKKEWGRLLGERRTRLCRMAYVWSKDPSLAEDLVQEALIRALRNRKQLRDPRNLDAWLFRILHNCWQDHLRHQARTRPLDDLPEPSFLYHPEEIQGRSEEIARVRSAVAALPEGQRQVLTLVDLEGLSYAQVAAVLDIPIGTVMSRLCRARGRLREILGNFDASSDPEREGVQLRRVK